MANVVVHIGLHKTATRFLQRAVFGQLDKNRFLVNPEPLFGNLKRALRHPNRENRAAAADAANQALAEAGERTLVISDPTISGDMYSQHEDWRQNMELVHDLFPGATVIYFVRRQSDWLQSAYRQSLVKGPGVPIEFFLNFREDRFHQRPARKIGRARTVNALGLRFLEIYRGYAETFGPERVYLFRQEDLRRRPEAVNTRLAEALGTTALPEQPKRISGNRAFSALAIRLFFPGVHRWPRPDWSDKFHAPRFRRMERRMRKIRTALIRHVFDKLVYRDWPLLARNGMQEQLDAHYAEENEALAEVADQILEHGPASTALECARSSGSN
jgi:hypothetical protein